MKKFRHLVAKREDGVWTVRMTLRGKTMTGVGISILAAVLNLSNDDSDDNKATEIHQT